MMVSEAGRCELLRQWLRIILVCGDMMVGDFCACEGSTSGSALRCCARPAQAAGSSRQAADSLAQWGWPFHFPTICGTDCI